MHGKKSEIELLQSCLQGQGASFELLVSRYQSLVCAITYSATLNLDKSEELAQETFLLAWKNLRQLQDLSKFKAWLCRIAKSVVLNWLRARQRDVLVKSAPLEDASAQTVSIEQPVDAVVSEEQQAMVNQALEEIPETYRVPLILYYRESKSTREVGDLIGLNENATRQRIARARQMLKGQVAAMVETTLNQSRPGKAFVAGVMASLAGVSMKGTATAAVAGTVTAGISAGILKITSLAAGLLVVAGVSVWVYNREPTTSSPPHVQNIVPDSNVGGQAQVLAGPNSLVSDFMVGPDETAAEETNALVSTVNPQPLVEAAAAPYVFKPRGVLSGLITCAETGVPVRDASIRINGQDRRHIKTDINGFYFVDKTFNPGSNQLFIDSNDYVGYGSNSNAPMLNLSPGQQVVQHFQLPRACKVRVKVVDTNGLGLKGVSVVPTSLVGNPYHVINDQGPSRRTNHQGFVLLGGFPPLDTDYMITAMAEEVIRRQHQGGGLYHVEEQYAYFPARALVRLTDPNVTTDVTIVLERGQTVFGYAEFSDGQPARDIKLGLQPTWWHCPGGQNLHRVQADGTFRIPHVIPGTYDIVLAHLDADGLTASSSIVMQAEVNPVSGDPLTLQLPIASPQAGVAISGRLNFLGEERPHDVFISVRLGRAAIKEHYVALSGMPRNSRSKEFTINGLEEDAYDLIVTGPRIRRVVLEEVQAPAVGLEVDVEPVKSPSVVGTVIGKDTQEPISDFQIRAKVIEGNSGWEADRWVSYRHDEGYFKLDLFGHGVYQIQVLAEGYAPTWSNPFDTDKDPDKLVVVLSRGGILKGQIVNQAGEPISQAKVIPLSLSADTRKRTEHLFATEKGAVITRNGSFSFSHIPEGVEAIQIKHPDYAMQVRRDIAISAGQTTYLDDLVLTTGGALEGVVLDGQGLPKAKETLCFCDAETGSTTDPDRRWATTVTDVNGYYRVEHLPPRKCYVYRENRGQATGVTRRTVTPVEGESIRLDFGGDYRVTGTLTLEEGNPAQQRLAISGMFPTQFECLTYTDDQGQFSFTGIVPGSYYLRYLNKSETPRRWIRIAPVTVTDANLDLDAVHGRESPPLNSDPLAALRSVSSEPIERTLSIKLPLLQPRFHWTFYRQVDLLAGKLSLRIIRNQQTQEIVIFQDGKFSEGWTSMPFPQPKVGEVYFSFQSSHKYLTTPSDRLEIELEVVQDLDGIGALQTGYLPAGRYRSSGTYDLVTDEYEVPEAFKSMPPEVVEKMRENLQFKAMVETWDTSWPLVITGEQGWLEGEQREVLLKTLERLDAQEN